MRVHRTERSWSDQPAILESLPVRISLFTKGRIIELRSDGDKRHFVTTGNLFGSQTIICETLIDAVEAVGIAAEASEHGRIDLPKGCSLMGGATN